MTDAEMQNDEVRMQNEERLPILCLVRDLMFYSKIRAAAESAGVQLKSLRDPAKLADETGPGLIVDLNQENALQAAIAWRQKTNRAVIGFVSHVDTQTINTARAAGIDRVYARSQFEKNLPEILRSICQQTPDAGV
jgi:hypothetical protein